jgi:cation diffusion facilitator CzcD-associated flavoprotein CzcO
VTPPLDVAVIGAGPFGLSVAAHLGDRARVFGTPMQTWRTRMPPDMLMRSAWEETSLSAAGGAGTIDEWAAATGEEKVEPLPLQTFLRYADWFRERYVADHDPDDVALVEDAGDGLRVTTAGGAAVDVRAVVVAVGVTPFPHAPPVFAPLLGSGVGFAVDEQDVSGLAGRRVLVVGAGQAGLETAGIAAREGAEVELVTRSDVRWFADREPQNFRGPVRRRLYRLAYPAVGYGPPPLNRLVLHPDLFAALPPRLRRRLTGRLLRPGGSPWVRGLVEGRVRVTEAVVPVRAEANGAVRVELSDGSSREVDRVLLATGYRFDAARLEFLDEGLRRRLRTEDGWPVLDRHFRSSDPRLLFAGYAAEGRFGPISRFVLGCDFTASRIAAAL